MTLLRVALLLASVVPGDRLADQRFLAQAEFEAEVRKDPTWKPSRTQNDRKRGMELTIRREGKAITKLEKDLVAYRKSLDVLKQMNRKQGSAASASTSTDAMDEEQRDAAADKQVSAVPNARFMSSDEVDESLVQRYGSKMAHLFVYVKGLVENDDNNRIIVFSQWDKMLGHVSTHTLNTTRDTTPAESNNRRI